MTGGELPMATGVKLTMGAGAELARAVCIGAELAMAASAELAHGRATLSMAARTELARALDTGADLARAACARDELVGVACVGGESI